MENVEVTAFFQGWKTRLFFHPARQCRHPPDKQVT
jgi:hypothetical protein